MCYLLKYELEKKTKTIWQTELWNILVVVNLTEINYVYKETHVNTAFTLNCIRWVYMCLIYLKKKKNKTTLACLFWIFKWNKPTDLRICSCKCTPQLTVIPIQFSFHSRSCAVFFMHFIVLTHHHTILWKGLICTAYITLLSLQ